MPEDNYLPGSCPVCGYFGKVGEFLVKYDNGRVRLACPKCHSFTVTGTLWDAICDWINGKVEEGAESE